MAVLTVSASSLHSSELHWIHDLNALNSRNHTEPYEVPPFTQPLSVVHTSSQVPCRALHPPSLWPIPGTLGKVAFPAGLVTPDIYPLLLLAHQPLSSFTTPSPSPSLVAGTLHPPIPHRLSLPLTHGAIYLPSPPTQHHLSPP